MKYVCLVGLGYFISSRSVHKNVWPSNIRPTECHIHGSVINLYSVQRDAPDCRCTNAPTVICIVSLSGVNKLIEWHTNKYIYCLYNWIYLYILHIHMFIKQKYIHIWIYVYIKNIKYHEKYIHQLCTWLPLYVKRAGLTAWSHINLVVGTRELLWSWCKEYTTIDG